MIQYEVFTGKLTQLITFYDEWEIPEKDRLTNWHKLTILDKGKYILFNDGSGLYGRIYSFGKDYVRTSGGMARIKDIVHCSKPRYVHWGYSGASDNEESFQVRPASKNELAKVSRVLHGHQPRTMTRRLRMLLLEDLQSQISDNEVNEKYIIERLKSWSDGNGQHAYKSLVTMARIQGIEIEKPLDNGNDNRIGVSIAQQLGITGTIQDKRKQLPSPSELKKIATAEEPEVSEVMNVNGVYKNA